MNNQKNFKDILTVNDAKLIANKFFGSDVRLLSYTIKPFSSDKIGFLASHQRLQLLINDSNSLNNIKLEFFVKIVPYDVPSQATYILERGVFNQEAIFYKKIVPHLLNGFKGDPWCPECYLIKKDILVFEDLTRKNFSMQSNKTFDEKLIKAGLKALANLHSSSIIAEEYLGKPLNEMYPEAFKELVFLRSGNQYKWYLAGIDVAMAIAEQMGLDSSFIRKACEKVFKAMEPSLNKRNVVSHGDLWANNLLFDNESPTNCRLVDFQLLRYSPLAHDVTQFLYLCSTRQFRLENSLEMLKYYYNTLVTLLNQHSKTILKPSWIDIIQGYEEQKLAALITALMYFPTVLLDGQLGAKIMNDSKSYIDFVFCDRRKVVLNNMKEDCEYNARLKETVDELVQMSFQLDSLPTPS